MATRVSPASRWDGTRSDLLLLAMGVGTYTLILIGIYTAAIGAGLTCDGRWPLCDGAVFGLFPANWPSFVEWFHRLVAMLTGFLILGGWAVVWRSGRSRRATAAMSAVVVLLPIQIWLGRETVLGYEIIALTAHFLTALLIFGGIVLAVTWYWKLDRLIPPFTSRLLLVALVLMVPFVILTPRLLVIHTGEVQFLYYGIGLAIFVSLLLVALAGVTTIARGLGAIGLGLLVVQLLAGRLVRTPMIELIDWTAAALLLILIGIALYTVHDRPNRRTRITL